MRFHIIERLWQNSVNRCWISMFCHCFGFCREKWKDNCENSCMERSYEKYYYLLCKWRRDSFT